MLQFNKEFDIHSLLKFLSSMITSFKPVCKTCYYSALRQRNGEQLGMWLGEGSAVTTWRSKAKDSCTRNLPI
jgi:hypothetical protein